jgi:hypothetical protein
MFIDHLLWGEAMFIDQLCTGEEDVRGSLLIAVMIHV